MEQNNVTISVTLIVVFVCLFVVLLGMMLQLINGILNSFAETERNVDMLLANVGHTERGIADGMVEVKNANSVELSNMQSSMNAMIATLQRARNDRMNVITTAENSAGFQGMTQFCNMVPLTTVVQAPQVFYTYPEPAQAPPAYA